MCSCSISACINLVRQLCLIFKHIIFKRIIYNIFNNDASHLQFKHILTKFTSFSSWFADMYACALSVFFPVLCLFFFFPFFKIFYRVQLWKLHHQPDRGLNLVKGCTHVPGPNTCPQRTPSHISHVVRLFLMFFSYTLTFFWQAGIPQGWWIEPPCLIVFAPGSLLYLLFEVHLG